MGALQKIAPPFSRRKARSILPTVPYRYLNMTVWNGRENVGAEIFPLQKRGAYFKGSPHSCSLFHRLISPFLHFIHLFIIIFFPLETKRQMKWGFMGGMKWREGKREMKWRNEWLWGNGWLSEGRKSDGMEGREDRNKGEGDYFTRELDRRQAAI